VRGLINPPVQRAPINHRVPSSSFLLHRGDTAFCSLECRQQHITIEEWKDKCTALATTHQQADDHQVTKKPASESPADNPTAAAGGGGGGMLAAA
jgi:hypothetical protein